MAELTKMEKLISLCKRRGFIFQSAEKYGGLQGFWDFGPLGVELKNNIKKAWWKDMVQMRGDVVGLDSSIITNPMVWEKSGHSVLFGDFKVECKECHQRFKVEDFNLKIDSLNVVLSQANKLAKGEYKKEELRDIEDNINNEIKLVGDYLQHERDCSNCGKRNWANPEFFNLMFKTSIGPVESSASTAYLRPETAQSIFVDFDIVRQSRRLKVPFGIAQIGKAFRNEITPGNFIFRSREFEQMEMEFFINPKDDNKWFKEWLEARFQWYQDYGIKKAYLHQYEQKKDELAHYAKHAVDIEYDFPFGKKELEGIHNRTDYDLKAHGLEYRDEETKEKYIPYVIETSAGVDRAALAFLLDAYEEVKGGRTTTTESNKEQEVVLRLHKDLAPFKVAVLPLSKKEKLASVAQEIYKDLQKQFMCVYDDVASIGRRYRRQDEIGTPYCITVDFESLDDKKVTVRDRDTMKQARVEIVGLVQYMKGLLD